MPPVAIEKMMYVNVVGFAEHLDATIAKCVDSGAFHIEDASKTVEEDINKQKIVQKLDSKNPYKDILKNLLTIHFGEGFNLHQTTVSEEVQNMTVDEMDWYINFVAEQLLDINNNRFECRQIIEDKGLVLELLEHLNKMPIKLEKLFGMKNIHIRFGKLPLDSVPKLEFYDSELFEFVGYDRDTSYQWGVYFVPNEYSARVDKIFNSLYFERIYIPPEVHLKPDEEIKKLEKQINEAYEHFEFLTRARTDFNESVFEKINHIYCRLKTLYDNYNLRTKAVFIKNNFYLVGFVPMSDIGNLSKALEDIPSVEIIVRAPQKDDVFRPPVKLRNNKFSAPFAMFVEMYGLPTYGGFNPTNFVAITYTLLFGIMFGDLGQGLVIALLGALLHKITKNEFGAILLRIGLSSAVFGFLFGSVFGFEEALDPIYERIGISFLPIRVMHYTTEILGTAIGIGVIIILITIIFNIVQKLKRRNLEEAIFGNNGIIGFIFFASLLAGLVAPIIFNVNLWSYPYVFGLIILPVVLMFFREPLGCVFKGKKFEMHTGIGDFIATNFFEVFEFLLGYATNTLSFVRIGGFVFSHAGMMTVVMLLAEMANNASPLVVILGNIFVMGMEGLIVGIQVLRLEFYEVFSRFYEADGSNFTPVKVKYDATIE